MTKVYDQNNAKFLLQFSHSGLCRLKFFCKVVAFDLSATLQNIIKPENSLFYPKEGEEVCTKVFFTQITFSIPFDHNLSFSE